MMWQTVSEGLAQARREMAVRKRRDISHQEIAKAVGVTPAAYSRWEKGQRIPAEEDVQKLAKFFGVTPAYLRYGVRDNALRDPTTLTPGSSAVVLDPSQDERLSDAEVANAREAAARLRAAREAAKTKPASKRSRKSS